MWFYWFIVLVVGAIAFFVDIEQGWIVLLWIVFVVLALIGIAYLLSRGYTRPVPSAGNTTVGVKGGAMKDHRGVAPLNALFDSFARRFAHPLCVSGH